MKTLILNSVATASALTLTVLFLNELALAQACPAPSFASAVHYGTGSGCWSVAVGDFNSDGRPDLATANERSGNVSVLLNRCASTSVHLDIVRTSTDLILSWPLSNVDFHLQSTTNFNSTNWQQVLELWTTNNGRCEAIVPLDQVQRYFRLGKP